MAKSKQKTRLAELREHLGELGKETNFIELTGLSNSWLKKASCGAIPILPEKALWIQSKTGFSAEWILGETDHLQMAGKEEPLKIAERLVERYKRTLYAKLGIPANDQMRDG